jgi:lysozyme family protein
MARLPVPGSDKNTWGDILNEFLAQSHKSSGVLKDGIVGGATIAANAIATAHLQSSAVTTAKLSSGVQATLNSAVTEVVQDKQWVILGSINVAAGDVDYIAPAFISVPAGSAAAIVAVRGRINSGTNANLRVTLNGSTISGLSSVAVTTSGVSVTGLDVAVADGDLIAPVVNSTSGGPQNMTFEVVYRITKS